MAAAPGVPTHNSGEQTERRTKAGGRDGQFPDADQWRRDYVLSEHEFKQTLQTIRGSSRGRNQDCISSGL